MRIEKDIYFEQTIEIDLTSEDIYLAFSEVNNCRDFLHQMSNILTFLKGIPDNILAELSNPQKTQIKTFFLEQANRIKIEDVSNDPVHQTSRSEGESSSMISIQTCCLVTSLLG